MKYDVAIITVSTNKLDEECLSSVAKVMAASPLKMQFVVVDNASTVFDARARVLRHVKDAIVVLRGDNHGFGRSCNRGAQEVEADYYFFLNPDTRIDDVQAIDRLYAFMKQHPKTGIVAPRIRYMDGRVQETCRRFPAWHMPLMQRTRLFGQKRIEAHRKQFLMEDFSHDRRRMVDWVQGSAFMIEAPLYNKLGGFDDRFFMYFEDIDLCRRVWKEGRPVYYLPEAELFHAYGKESAKINNVVEGFFRNHKTRVHIWSWLKYTLKWGHRSNTL